MLKVILVDDEKLIVEGLTRLINWKALNMELVGRAYEGKGALEMILKEEPHIVITDIKMPIMDGLELIEAVRKQNEVVKFIILSGFGEFEYAKKAIRLGVKDYLLKPCNEKEVEASLKKVAEEIKGNTETAEALAATGEVVDNICITQIKLCVEKYISNSEMSLKWIAEKHLYMNSDYLSKQFVKITGEKFSNYLNRIRVNKAKELLKSHDSEKMVAIAEAIGLGHNPQYFSKIFKKSVGYTPTDYQRIYYIKKTQRKV